MHEGNNPGTFNTTFKVLPRIRCRRRSAATTQHSRSLLGPSMASTPNNSTANSSTRAKIIKVAHPPLKVVVRRLPHEMKEEQFVDVVTPAAADAGMGERGGSWDLIHFASGKMSKKRGRVTSTAYIRIDRGRGGVAADLCLIKLRAAILASDALLSANEKSTDKNGPSSPSVEAAPFQKLFKQKPKRDARVGTIEKDPDYKAFCAKLEKPPPMLPSADVQADIRESEGKEEPKPSNALLDFLKERGAKRMRDSHRAALVSSSSISGTARGSRGGTSSISRAIAAAGTGEGRTASRSVSFEKGASSSTKSWTKASARGIPKATSLSAAPAAATSKREAVASATPPAKNSGSSSSRSSSSRAPAANPGGKVKPKEIEAEAVKGAGKGGHQGRSVGASFSSSSSSARAPRGSGTPSSSTACRMPPAPPAHSKESKPPPATTKASPSPDNASVAEANSKGRSTSNSKTKAAVSGGKSSGSKKTGGETVVNATASNANSSNSVAQSSVATPTAVSTGASTTSPRSNTSIGSGGGKGRASGRSSSGNRSRSGGSNGT